MKESFLANEPISPQPLSDNEKLLRQEFYKALPRKVIWWTS